VVGRRRASASHLFRIWRLHSFRRIKRIEICLHALFAFGREARKLDTVTHSRIASSHYRRNFDVLRIQPKIQPQHRSERQRQHVFNVAAITAYVAGVDPRGRIDPFVPNFQGKRKLVPVPSPAVRRGDGDSCPAHGQVVFPGTFLVGDELYSNLIFTDETGVHRPYDAAARFFLLALHSNHVADF